MIMRIRATTTKAISADSELPMVTMDLWSFTKGGDIVVVDGPLVLRVMITVVFFGGKNTTGRSILDRIFLLTELLTKEKS